MDKTILKNFAVYARDKLIQDTKTQAALYGITEKEIIEPNRMADVLVFNANDLTITGELKNKYNRLIKEIKKRSQEEKYEDVYKGVIEEISYTWFNRLVAIRLMELNGYLPNGSRVLSSLTPEKIEPDILSEYEYMDLEISLSEKKQYHFWIDKGDMNSYQNLFNNLFLKECKYLSNYLPDLFEKDYDYADLLLNISYIDQEGVVFKLIHDIPEEYFIISEESKGQIEIIGWLYQFYTSKYKSEIDSRPEAIKISKEDLPAETQLFTPRWIVKYMVENTIGRYYIENELKNLNLSIAARKNKEKDIANKFGWNYFISDVTQSHEKEDTFIKSDWNEYSLEKMKFLDPCMGSGHILIYAFDVLMQLYEDQGIARRDAAQCILANNIFGIDIDKRAYQLTYFSLMMKGREYDRRFFRRNIKLNICEINESNYLDIENFDSDDECYQTITHLKDIFHDAKEYGSLVLSDNLDYEYLSKKLSKFNDYSQNTITNRNIMDQIPLLQKLILQAKLMNSKYDCVVTNPPYLYTRKMNTKLKKYLSVKYPKSKTDLYAAFIERCKKFTQQDKWIAMITMHSWMFTSSYEKLRKELNKIKINSMVHLGTRAFEEIGGEVVQTTSFVMRNSSVTGHKGVFIRLVDFGNAELKNEKLLEALNTPNCDFYHESNQDDFNRIPGSPIAYWASENILKAFDNGTKMSDLVDPKQGLATANNDRFLRYWWEVDNNNIKYDTISTEESKISGYKWVPYNKGGERRQWYGNYDYIVNWENDGYEIKHFTNDKGKLRSRPQNTGYYFKEAITWPLITSSEFSIRYREKGSIHDVAGMSAFNKSGVNLWYILGLMSTTISNYIFKFINPTINLQIGDFNNFPVILKEDKRINELVINSINISKNDWDTFENSWNFMSSPLIIKNYITEIPIVGSSFASEEINLDVSQVEKALPLELAYDLYKEKTNSMFNELKENEEKLNHIFLEIYGLENELTPEVSDRDITIAKIFDSLEDIDHEIKGNQYILTKEKVIKQFLSYIVGCVFGRYSLDKEGLILTDGNFEGQYDIYENQGYLKELVYNNNSEINSDITEVAKGHFGVSIDNIIPITEEKILDNDIVNKVIDFLKYAFGEESLKDNLEFIAEAIGGKEEPEAVIRNYFIKDFYKDHIKAYNKRPIYWLYDSGKFNGFKALVYMHRYDADTTGKVRMDYLHEVQKHYDRMIAHFQYQVDNNSNPREVVKAEKSINKYRKQVKECEEYDENIGHLALDRIEIDLDDGVKVNYEKIQTDKNDKHHQILQKLK